MNQVKYCICTGEGHREGITTKFRRVGGGCYDWERTPWKFLGSSRNVSAHFIITLNYIFMFFTYLSVYKKCKNKSYDLLNKWWPIEQIINKIIL